MEGAGESRYDAGPAQKEARISTISPPLRRAPAPWHGIGLGKWLFYRLSWLIWAIPTLLVFRARAIRAEVAPQEGPYLLLPNHSSLFDPFWVAWHLRRPVRFMTTAHLFRIPVLRWFLQSIGGFPKMKFVKDQASMETLNALYAAGLPIMVFPEGNRSWDGRPQPVLPGIGRLVQRLEARVVFARVRTGHLFHPRWARYPRWVPLQVEYDGPYTFGPEVSAEEITAQVRERVCIDYRAPAPAGSWGVRLAHGLPSYLWACPQCFALDGLSVAPDSGDAVVCGGCRARWRLDVSSRLTGEAGPAEDMHVVDAWDRIQARFGSPPLLDPRRFAQDGVILEEPGWIGEVRRRSAPHRIGTGLLRLYADRLALITPEDGETIWALRLVSVRAVSVEMGSVLQLRTSEALYQVNPAGAASVRWAQVLESWWEQIRPADASTRPTVTAAPVDGNPV